MPYTLHHSIDLNGDTLTKVTLVCDDKYVSIAQECSFWYLDPEVGSTYIIVSLKAIFIPTFNVELITITM